MLKKIMVGLGALLGLLVIAAIVIPLVVDVDKYRPEIQQAINSNINGKVELGKLKLSLWGRVLVQVGGVKLTGPDSKQILAVSDAAIHIPLLPLITGSPSLVFKMKSPQVSIIKGKDGQMNVMKLMKKSPEQAQAAAAPAETAAAPSEAAKPRGEATPQAQSQTVAGSKPAPMQIPSMARNARLSAEILNATIQYQDATTGLNNTLNDLNVVAKDVSLSRPFEIEVWADLKTTLGKSLNVTGPFKITSEVETKFSDDGKLQMAKGRMTFNVDDMIVSVPGAFEKGDDVDANAEMEFEMNEKEASLKKFKLIFFNANIDATGSLANPLAEDKSNSAITFDLKSNDISLKSWNKLLPPLREYDLSGGLSISASAKGTMGKPDYRAGVKLNQLMASAPTLKAKPIIDAELSVVTDQVEKLAMIMKAPGNDLRVNGRVVSFTAPRASISVASTGMDLDQLIDFKKMKDQKKTAALFKTFRDIAGEILSASAIAAPNDPAQKTTDLDKSVEPLRTNAMIRNANAAVDVNLKFIKAQGVNIGDIQSKMNFDNLVGKIDFFRFNVFKGKIDSKFSTDLKPARPTYQFAASVNGLMMEEAVKSQLELFKNTAYGSLFLDMKGSGQSFNADLAKKNLNASGKFQIKNAIFTTIDVNKVTVDAVNGAVTKLADKVPQLKGKQLNRLGERSSKYEVISSDFTLKDGRFVAPNFKTVAAKNQGIDLAGRTEAGLIDYSLKAQWKVIDTYNMTKAKDVQNGVLAKKGEPVSFPISVGCKLDAPCYDYKEVPSYLAEVALKNTVGGVTDKVKGKAKEQLKNKAKDVLKKFGF